MIMGTCNFVSFKAACEYYALQGLFKTDIDLKLIHHEIEIGRPNYNDATQTLEIKDGRYHIVDKAPVLCRFKEN